jgi:hypothetical protein
MNKATNYFETQKVLLSGLGLLAAAGLALADDITSGHSGLEPTTEPEKANVFQANPGFTYQADADFNDSKYGKFSTTRADLPMSYTFKREAGDLRVGAFYEYSEYDSDKFAGTQDFNTVFFDLLWKSMLNDNWGYFLYGGAGFSSSTHATFTDGLTGVGGGGAQYVWSPDLSLGFGLAVGTQLEDDPRVLPIINLNWQINDRWKLTTLNGATISYDVLGDKRLFADFTAKYQFRDYRVGNDTSITDQQILIELGATYRFCPEFALRAFAGVAAGRKLEVRHNGNEVTSQDVDPGAIVGVRGFITF